jgi:hypothetical protein
LKEDVFRSKKPIPDSKKKNNKQPNKPPLNQKRNQRMPHPVKKMTKPKRT